MPDRPIGKTAAADITLTFGLVSTVGKLVPVTRPNKKKESSFKFSCPNHDEPTVVQRRYLCSVDETHGPFTDNDLSRCKEIDGRLVPITEEEHEEVRESLREKKIIEFFCHKRDEVPLYPSSHGLRFQPTAAVAAFNVFYEWASSKNYVLVGVLRLRDTETFYVLTVIEGDLVLQPCLFPADMGGTVDVPVSLDKDTKKMARDVLENNVKEFMPDDYINTRDEKMADLVRSKVGQGVEMPKRQKATPEDASLKALEQMLVGDKNA